MGTKQSKKKEAIRSIIKKRRGATTRTVATKEGLVRINDSNFWTRRFSQIGQIETLFLSDFALRGFLRGNCVSHKPISRRALRRKINQKKENPLKLIAVKSDKDFLVLQFLVDPVFYRDGQRSVLKCNDMSKN